MPINVLKIIQQCSARNRMQNISQDSKPIFDNSHQTAFHRPSIEKYFSDQLYFEGNCPVINRPLIVLAFTNRSGSNLLADFLCQTSLVAGLGEYLNHETVVNKSISNKISSFPDYFLHLGLRVSRKGQSFGVKASAEQLKFITDWRLNRMFTRTLIVHIHRDDIYNQAISHWIAGQTGQWTSLQKKKESAGVIFDGPKILNIVNDIIIDNNSIHLHCMRERLNYISISYQEVISDPKAVVLRIFQAAELDIGDWTPSEPKISKQSSIINERMLQDLFAYIGQAG